MRVDIFLNTAFDNSDAEFVRQLLVNSTNDAHYLWYLLSGSGYITVNCDTEDQYECSPVPLVYDADQVLGYIDGTKQLLNLLNITELGHSYKWADNSIDKLTVVCLALYKALA